MPRKRNNNRKQSQPRRRRRTRKLGMNTGRVRGNQESIHVSYRELWTSVSGTTSSPTAPLALQFLPGASGLPQLDAIGSLYESYRLTAPVRVEFKSSSGTINNGSIIAGVDYDGRDISTGYSAAAALMPKFVGPIWKDHSLSVEPARAMNKKWLFSQGPTTSGEAAFAVVYSATGSAGSGAVGDIWCQYSVEFISPKISTTSTGGVMQMVYSNGALGNSVPANVGPNPPQLQLFPIGTPGPTAGITGYQALTPLEAGRYLLVGSLVSDNGSGSPGWTIPAGIQPFVVDQANPTGAEQSIIFDFPAGLAGSVSMLSVGWTKAAADILSILFILSRTVKTKLS